MSDEHYILLQEASDFFRRFSLIFVNTINHIESLHFEYHHKTIEIITRMANILQTHSSGPSTLPHIIDPNADVSPILLFRNSSFARSTLTRLNLLSTPDDKSWISNTFSLLHSSAHQHLQGYRYLCHKGRTDFFNSLQRLIKVLRAGNLQIMESEDKFQTSTPQTFVPTPFPHSTVRHEEVTHSLLWKYDNFIDNFILIFVVAIEGVRMTLHDHHRDDLAVSVDIAEMVHACATEVHNTLHNAPNPARNPDDLPVSK